VRGEGETHAHLDTHIYIYVCVYIYRYTHTHTHTYTYLARDGAHLVCFLKVVELVGQGLEGVAVVAAVVGSG
jgi:hypothetical protein